MFREDLSERVTGRNSLTDQDRISNDGSTNCTESKQSSPSCEITDTTSINLLKTIFLNFELSSVWFDFSVIFVYFLLFQFRDIVPVPPIKNQDIIYER